MAVIIQRVTTTPDPTLPLYLPTLPHAVTHRWVADSVLTDGDAIIPPAVGTVNLTDASGGSTTLPTAGLEGGLRAFTFNGTDDMGFALNVNPGPGGTVTSYAVVKIMADPAAARSIVHWSTSWLGFNSARRFNVGSAVLSAPFALDTWYVVAGSMKRNTGTGDAEWRCADSTGQSAEVLNQNQAAITTYVAFGTGSANVKTSMVVRDLAVTVGAAHTLAQMAANIAALKTEYGIA